MRRIPGKDIMSLYVKSHNYSSTYAKATEKDGITRIDTEAHSVTDVASILAISAITGFGVRAVAALLDKSIESLPKIPEALKKITSTINCMKDRKAKVKSDPNAKEGIDDEEDIDD